ncbi:conserved hypothetical protein [Beutenbergia cavernae DSM 12333]|uniref:Asp23/Gls24 family envelope stress response protein n=2 Tax=Beutenbergia TaxID=84756 RepID=C5C281_BEUC1|nr:conserved hypothetical protein [Beutenbergia cavernae DSM 12333]
MPSPASRGRLVVTERALGKVVRHVLRDAPGVATSHAPRVACDIAGDRARIDVDVAIEWPRPAVEVCQAVVDALRSRLPREAGLQPDHIELTVVDVVAPAATATRRVE